MIPIQLTENDYINPEAVCRLHCQPKTDDRRATKRSNPYRTGGTALFTTTAYDEAGRP